MTRKTRTGLMSFIMAVAIALTLLSYTVPARAGVDIKLQLDENGIMTWNNVSIGSTTEFVTMTGFGDAYGYRKTVDVPKENLAVKPYFDLKKALIENGAYDGTYSAELYIYKVENSGSEEYWGERIADVLVEYTLVLDKPRHSRIQNLRWNYDTIEWEAPETATKDTTYTVELYCKYYGYNKRYVEKKMSSVKDCERTSIKIDELYPGIIRELNSEPDNYLNLWVVVRGNDEKDYYGSPEITSEKVAPTSVSRMDYCSPKAFHGAASISCDTTPEVGNTISLQTSGDFSKLAEDEMYVSWQIQCEDGSFRLTEHNTDDPRRWEIIPQARGRYVRANVCAASDKYLKTYVASNTIYIPRTANTDIPVAPEVSVGGNNKAIYVNNADPFQEYLVTTSVFEPTEDEWEKATSSKKKGKFKLETDVSYGQVVYVWTRMADKYFWYTGTVAVYTAVYFGDKQANVLAGTMLSVSKASGDSADKTGYRLGDVLKVDVSPCPERAYFSGFQGRTWAFPFGTKNSQYGVFYEDAACTTELENGKEYKTVYLKLTNTAGNSLYISCGTTSTKGAIATIDVAFEDGTLAVSKVRVNDSYIIGKGSKRSDFHYTYAPLGCETYLKNVRAVPQFMSEAAPKVSFGYEDINNGVMTIDASAESCEEGLYTYDIMYGSSKLDTMKISVLPEDVVPLEGLLFDEEDLSCGIGEYIMPKLILIPYNAWDVISYSSSDESIATVSDKGYVFMSKTAQPGQKVTITASCGDISASCEVTAVELYKEVDIAKCNISVADQAWTGEAIKPDIRVTYLAHSLVEGTEYVATITDNKDPGTATVTIYGIGDYRGTKTVTFSIKKAKLKYRAYVQKKGWMSWQTAALGTDVNDTVFAGTTDNLRMETIQMQLSGINGEVRYRAYVEKNGWTQWATTKDTTTYAGTKGQSKRVEMIQLQAKGQVSNLYDIYYRTYCEKFGWLGWAGNNEKSGSAGYARKLEAFQVQFVTKGAKFNKGKVKAFYDKTKDGEKP